METLLDQKQHLTDLPPEVIGEIVARASAKDVESLASTCSYLRDTACANALWIRRCKNDFGIEVDPRVAEENGIGSVHAFYILILDNLGPFLGPLKRKNLEHYGGLYQLVHDGKLGLHCLQWVPPPPNLGLKLPMKLRPFLAISLGKSEVGEHMNMCTAQSLRYRVVYKVLDKFNGSSVVKVRSLRNLHIETLNPSEHTTEPNMFEEILDALSNRDLGVHSADVSLDQDLDEELLEERAMKSPNTEVTLLFTR